MRTAAMDDYFFQRNKIAPRGEAESAERKIETTTGNESPCGYHVMRVGTPAACRASLIWAIV